MNTPVPPLPAQTTLQPGAQAQAIVSPTPSNKYDAYRQIGLIKNIDFMLLALVVSHGITAIFAGIFGKLTLLFGSVLAIQAVILLLLWIVLLVFRVGVFVVELRANIELLPFDSARIAVGFLQGGTPLNTPVQR